MLTPNISVVIPAFNEAEAIAHVVTKTREQLQAMNETYEILVVNDGSSDATQEQAAQAGATVLSHPYNRGYGASLKTAIKAARGTTIIMLDADGQHDPADIVKLMAERTTYDMVVGARYRGSAGSPLWRKPGKWVLARVANFLTGHRIPDLNSGYRAISRMLLERIAPLMPDGFSFSTTSTIAAFRCGYTVGYVPIHVAKRAGGKSSVTIKDGFKTMMLIVRLVALFSPLRACLPVTCMCGAIGVGFIVASYLEHGEASLKGIVVILAGLMFFFFGILMDQVAALRRGEHMQS